MSMKYKLVRKVNPTLKKKQWYAIPQYSLRQAGDKTVRSAARNTTFSYAEVMAALSLVGEYVPTILAEGHWARCACRSAARGPTTYATSTPAR